MLSKDFAKLENEICTIKTFTALHHVQQPLN